MYHTVIEYVQHWDRGNMSCRRIFLKLYLNQFFFLTLVFVTMERFKGIKRDPRSMFLVISSLSNHICSPPSKFAI